MAKGTIPKGASLSAEQNSWFEARALRELERLPTRSWGDMVALWRMLPSAWPSTRRRILSRCLELASKRGDPLSGKIAGYAIRELDSRAPRASVHHDLDRAQDGLRKLARHLARNPGASLRELAAAAGSKKTTVRLWTARSDFKAYLNDEKVRVALEHADAHALDIERREHEQRGRRSKKRSPKKVLLNGK
jgi:hypothetical protein